MVRQADVQKTRCSNMAHSSVNGVPKKGGAGGSYTWEGAAEVTYEPFGFDSTDVGVVTVMVPSSEAIMKEDTSVQFEENLEDHEAFPCLPTPFMKRKECEQVASPTPDTELPADLADKWVVVAPPESDSLCPDALDSVNTQANARQMRCEVDNNNDSAYAIDWSRAGLPQSIMRQIIKASMNATHQGLYAKEHASTLPLDMLRAQTAQNGATSRQSSRSRKNSISRSSSKPRVVKQPIGRR